jgi:hypothetical protein
VKREGENFFGEDWTGKIALIPKENFSSIIPGRCEASNYDVQLHIVGLVLRTMQQ